MALLAAALLALAGCGSSGSEAAGGNGTTNKTLTFTTPGVIEIEEHTSDTLIAQLEVT